MSGSQPRVLRDRLDWQGTDQFSGDRRDRLSRWVRGAEGTANHNKRKNKGTEKSGRTVRHYGFIPARKGKFLFGGKYSLDRCPLMGTSPQLRTTGRIEDLRLK